MTEDHHLKRAITGPQYFTLAFGAVVGVAWLMIFGQLVGTAGPGGTVAALMAGGLLVLLVGFCYAEMAALRPGAGGELVWAFEFFGPGVSFLTGWILTLTYVAVCVFEAISLGQVAGMLFPGIEGPLLYELFGAEVRLGSVGIGIAVTLVLLAINIAGAKLGARTQEWITYLRLAMMVFFLGAAVVFAEPANLMPLFSDAKGEGALTAFLGVLVTAPLWYAGFSVFATATEERAEGSSPKAMARAVVAGIVGAMIFYGLTVLAISALIPWRDMVELDLAAASVFQVATGSPVVTKIVLGVAVLGVLTAWNAMLIGGSRVLFALGRASLAAPAFGHLSPRARTPVMALVFISLLCGAGVFLGKGFILAAVNITSAAFALLYFLTCVCVFLLRGREASAPRPWKTPGGRFTMALAALGSLAIVVIGFGQPWMAAGGKVPVEWIVFGGWFVLGLVVWLGGARLRGSLTRQERWDLLRGR